MNMLNIQDDIKKSLGQNLSEKIVGHRERFKKIFTTRYQEMLPGLIVYKNAQQVGVDFLKVEVALRNGYDVVIGRTTRDNIQVIGYATSQLTKNNPSDLFTDRTLRHGDIKFIIPKHLQLDYYKEISEDDDFTTGDFIVLRNKTFNYVSDFNILEHYVDELAEIVMSRYSISMQVKISNILIGEPGDETLNQVISDLYNGNPFVKVSHLFDPDEQIYHFQNESLAQNFQELKREYQNKVSELNNMLGMNSLAVEKSSGVSDTEANSNSAFTTTNANIYLSARNQGLNKLNKRYGFNLEAVYNDNVASEMSEILKDQNTEGGGDNGTGNTNPIQDYSE